MSSANSLASATDLPYPSFGGWVKTRRNELDWSQAKLAGRVGCALDTIRAIEQNRNNYRPSLEMAARLAECLEILPSQRADFVSLARNGVADRETDQPPEVPPDAVPNPAPNQSLQRTWMERLKRHHTFFLGITPLSVLTLTIFILVAVISVVMLVGGWLLVRSRTSPQLTIELPGGIFLAGDSPRVQVLVDGRAISSGEKIPRNARLEIKFNVQNTGVQSVLLGTLEAGARGPCADACTWNSNLQSFTRVRNLTLKPGETFAYESSRVLDEPGYYFVEPVIQDTYGKYGGIHPFTRIEFQVGD